MPSRTGFLSFLLGLTGMAAVVACGSESVEQGEPPTPPDPSETSSPGSETTPPPIDPQKVDEAPLAMTQLLAGFDYTTGYFQPSKKRVFSLTPSVSASMARLTVAKIEGANVEVSTLPVKGKVPTGRVEAMTYAEAIDRFVLIVRAMNPHRVEVVTLALEDAQATFETLPQSPATEPNGFMFGPLYPKGGSSILVIRGNDLLTLTIGPTATWSGKTSASGFYRGASTAIVLDSKRNRLIAYGNEVFDPVTMKNHFEPSIGTMPLSGPYSWTDVPMANVPPAESQGVAPNWAALDGQTPRLLAIVPVPATCGDMQCTSQSLWSANLAQGSWTKLKDHYNPPTMYKPWAVDDGGRRVFSHGDGKLAALPIDETSTLVQAPLAQKGDLGPMFIAATTVLSNGRIVSTDGAGFRIYDPSAAAPRWETFGKARLPSNVGHRPSLDEDPKTGELLLFGGADSNASAGSSDLYVIAKDGATITKQTVAASPPARVGHGGTFVGRALFIAGGVKKGTDSTYLDDVWTFDRDKNTWTEIAKLPKGLGGVTLRAGATSSELLAIGWSFQTVAPLAAIDIATGKARELTTEGEAPQRLWSVAPLGSCFVGYESGDSVDNTQPYLWRCKRTGDTVKWEKSPLDAHDEGLGGYPTLLGAGAPDGAKAYFVGRTLWSAVAKL